MIERVFCCLSDVFDVVEFDDVFQELLFRNRLREVITLNHIGTEFDNEVLLLFGLNAFLDCVEGKRVHCLVSAL